MNCPKCKRQMFAHQYENAKEVGYWCAYCDIIVKSEPEPIQPRGKRK